MAERKADRKSMARIWKGELVTASVGEQRREGVDPLD